MLGRDGGGALGLPRGGSVGSVHDCAANVERQWSMVTGPVQQQQDKIGVKLLKREKAYKSESSIQKGTQRVWAKLANDS